MLPGTGQEPSRNRRISNDCEAAGKAKLSTMRMPAEHERETKLLRFDISLRAMA